MYKMPSDEVIAKLDVYDREFPVQIAAAIKWIYSTLSWNGEDIAKRIVGLQPAVWNKYAQPGYQKARPQHCIAALSWVSQISMSAIIRGERIAQYWEGVNQDTISALVACGRLHKYDFSQFVKEISQYSKINTSGVDLYESLDKINEMSFDLLPPPSPLDLDDFRKDYYRSSAIALKIFREEHKISIDDMMRICNISRDMYLKIEDHETPIRAIPLVLIARLKFALNIENTVFFIAHMQKYKGCQVVREIQQARESLLVKLFAGMSQESLRFIADLAHEKHAYRENLTKLSGI